MGLYKKKKKRVEDQQRPLKVDANDRSTASTLKVDADNMSLASTKIDCTKIKNQ